MSDVIELAESVLTIESQSTQEPLAKCLSCAKMIYDNLYKCPGCGVPLHGSKIGEDHLACGSWITKGKEQIRVCESCANPM